MHKDCSCPFCEYEAREQKRKELHKAIEKAILEQKSEKPEYAKNFCRVFELPNEYPEGFCYNGGKPVMMLMVDWFNPWPDNPELKTWDQVKELLLPFLLEKIYVKPGKRYILITDFGKSLVFSKDEVKNG